MTKEKNQIHSILLKIYRKEGDLFSLSCTASFEKRKKQVFRVW